MHSILELFACNFLLWNSASVYRIAGFVFLHRNVLSTHIRKWYYHQNTVEFKESVANHFKLTLFEILPLTMGKNGVKTEEKEWKFYCLWNYNILFYLPKHFQYFDFPFRDQYSWGLRESSPAVCHLSSVRWLSKLAPRTNMWVYFRLV